MSPKAPNIATQIYAKFQHAPTADQKKVIEGVAAFLSEGCADDIFVLNGYAGTGKTTLLGAIVNGCGWPSVLLAPTGRAAKVLANHARRAASTIHRCIYRPKDETTYVLDCNRAAKTLFIVDEASMISNESEAGAQFGSGRLLDDLVAYVRSGKGCKLLLVGDNAQLPPINHPFSAALDRSYMAGYDPDLHYHTMSQVLRQQEESTILRNATRVREILTSGQVRNPRLEVGGNVDTVTGTEVQEAIDHCRRRYGAEETMVVAFENATAVGYNQMIRSQLVGMQEQIETGDQLMVVRNNYHFTERDKSCPTNFLANGDVAILKKLGRWEERYGMHYVAARLHLQDYDYELECQLMLDTLTTRTAGLDRAQQDAFYQRACANYPTLRGRALHKQLREDPFYNAVQVKFAYASTGHKAQGGQWRAVIIDSPFQRREVNLDGLRWLYTALTRATEQVYLVNFDERFF